MSRIIVIITSLLLPFIIVAQTDENPEEETYYIGLNPVAPFTAIRSDFTSLYLPLVADLEAGPAIFIGKIFNRNYNLETRVSYGSPRHSYRLFQVQSGLNYCFTTSKKHWHPYAGLFINVYSLNNIDTDVNNASLITQMSAGNRFFWKRCFIDLRLNQHIYALSWTTQDGGKAMSGFHESIYKWKSAYIPYIGINLGYMFR